jgi:hypothetical protein
MHFQGDNHGGQPTADGSSCRVDMLILEPARRRPGDVSSCYDEQFPESSIAILGHSVAGVTDRHFAHCAPLAFKATMTIPQPSLFAAPLKRYDRECPSYRTRFADAGAG